MVVGREWCKLVYNYLTEFQSASATFLDNLFQTNPSLNTIKSSVITVFFIIPPLFKCNWIPNVNRMTYVPPYVHV